MNKKIKQLILGILVSVISISVPVAASESFEVTKDLIIGIQFILNEIGYDCGTPDGILGAMTSEAIKQYQEDNGLTVDGEITEELVTMIGFGAVSDLFLPIKINNIYFQEQNDGTGRIKMYFDNLTDKQYSSVKIVYNIYDQNGTVLGEEAITSVNVMPAYISTGGGKIPYQNAHSIAVCKYIVQQNSDDAETTHDLNIPLKYTIEDIQSGKAKSNSIYLIPGNPVKNAEAEADFETLDILLSYLGKNAQEVTLSVDEEYINLFTYEGDWTFWSDYATQNLSDLAWNIYGPVSDEVAQDLLQEVCKQYGDYDGSYEMDWSTQQASYWWNDVNGYAVYLEYMPESSVQLSVRWRLQNYEEEMLGGIS